MGKYNTRKLQSMGRRRFLKSLSALGVSTAALQHMSKDALADITETPEDEVPRLDSLRHTNHEEVLDGKEPKREPVYYTIPRAEWNHIQAADDVMQRLSKNLEKRFGDSVKVGVRERGGSTRNRKVVVGYPEAGDSAVSVSESEIEDAVPGSMVGRVRQENQDTFDDEIPVEIEAIRPRAETYYDHTYREYGVPGGCRMNGVCTLGHPAWDNGDDDWVHTVAGHCVDRNEGVQQPSGNYTSRIGYVDKYRNDTNAPLLDVATIDLYSNISIDYGLASDDGDDEYKSISTSGTVGFDAIVDGVDSMWLGKQGCRTAVTSGPVKEYQRGAGNQKSFEIDAESDNGDSGGPHYRVEDDNSMLIAGVHYGTVSRDEWAAATAWEAVEDEFNVKA